MQANHDPNALIPLYEKPAWQSRSPIRRILYLWRTKPLVRWVMLMFFVTFTFMATYEWRTHSFARRVKGEDSKKDAEKEIKKVSEWDPCPQLISELDESRGPDYHYPHDAGSDSDTSKFDVVDESKWARVLPAPELLAMAKRGEKLPQNIIHQSWKNRHNIPKDFYRWSQDWRRLHGSDWVWVLWIDEDNRELIKTFYPEYLEVYDALPREIYRVDMVRNAYMHRFGGLYADLDLVPLTSLQDQLPIFHRDRSHDPLAITYLGHMGANEDWERWRSQDWNERKKSKAKDNDKNENDYEDDDDDEDDWDVFEHSVPNAFMVSTKPGHPFWLMTMDYVKDHIQYVEKPKPKKVKGTSDDLDEFGKSVDSDDSDDSNHLDATETGTEKEKPREVILLSEPEKLTGPVALKRCVKKWNKSKNRRIREAQGTFDQVVVLPDGKIYPFSWYDGSMLSKCICRRHSPHRDEKKCNSLFPGAWTITYWTHSWGW